MELKEYLEVLATEVTQRIRNEAAGMLGMNWPLVKEIVHRGLRDLSDELTDDGPDEGDIRQPGNYL